MFRRRFEREGEIAAALDNPHVVPLLDRGQDGDRHYLAVKFIAGQSLAERLADGPLQLRDLVRVVAHVGDALDALHRVGLVHRDVKPSNVMLDEEGQALLTDFGVARGAAHRTLTRVGRTVGTPDYLAPEVIRGGRAAPAGDIYGLGCLAYECATGSPPFAEKRTVAEICVAHLRGGAARPATQA